MGLSVPRNAEEAFDLASQVINGGLLEGPSHRNMTELLAARGYGWSIQDGKLQILKGSDVRPETALVLSAETGLVGSPGFGSPPSKGKPPTLRARALIFPEIVPGRKIDLRATASTGLFKAVRVTHTGDTHGQDWYTEIEAVPL